MLHNISVRYIGSEDRENFFSSAQRSAIVSCPAYDEFYYTILLHFSGVVHS